MSSAHYFNLQTIAIKNLRQKRWLASKPRRLFFAKKKSQKLFNFAKNKFCQKNKEVFLNEKKIKTGLFQKS